MLCYIVKDINIPEVSMRFSGFENTDFCFFVDMPENYKRIIRKKVKNFGNEVYKNLESNIKDSYKIHESHTVKDEIKKVWYSIGKAYQDRSPLQLCGMSIFMQIDQLGFNSIIRGGSFRDDKPIGLLYNKIATDPESFIQLLNNYNTDYYLKFFKRVPLKGKNIRPGLEKWETLCKIRLEKINFDLVEYILAILEQDKLPGIQITTGIKPGSELFKDNKKLVEKAVLNLHNLYKFLRFIEI